MTNDTRNRIRNIWHQMLQRCYNPSSDPYKYYGGKGVEVCDEWHYSLDAFYNWALNNGYESHLTIDRIDSNGNYEPTNCRWSTFKEQDNNRTNNIRLEMNGITHTIPEWSDIVGLKQHVIRCRIDRGWPVEEALTRKVGKYVFKNR